MLFERGNGVKIDEFRGAFALSDTTTYPDDVITKAIRYGCERVDLESRGLIAELIGKKEFPGDLNKNQAVVAEEAAAGCVEMTNLQEAQELTLLTSEVRTRRHL